MSKHTPGPGAVCNTCKTPFDTGLHADCGGDCLLCMAEAGDTDCALTAVTHLKAQRDALLEALKRMATIIDKMGDMPDGFIHPGPWRTLKCEEALTQARAAIKAVEESK